MTRKAVCSFTHRHPKRADYLVGPVMAARELLACRMHLPAAVDALTGASRPVGSYEAALPSSVPQIPVRALIRQARR